MEKNQGFIPYKADKEVCSKLGGGKFGKSAALSKGQSICLDFEKTAHFDSAALFENGGNCLKFKIYALIDGEWKMLYRQDRILGFHRCYLGNIAAEKLKIEITDCKKAVSLRGIYVYKSKKVSSDFKVSQYLRLDQQNFDELINDEDFSLYYNTVTDVILFEEAYIDKSAQIAFHHSEEFFARQLAAFRKILGNRQVKIWCCLFFDQNGANGKKDYNLTSDFCKMQHRQNCRKHQRFYKKIQPLRH